MRYLVLLVLLMASCANIDAGRRGVTYQQFSGEYGNILEPGITWVGANWSVSEYPIEQQSLDFIDVEVRSNDGLMLVTDITIFYQISGDEKTLHKLFESFRNDYSDRLIVPKVREVIRDIFGKFDAEVSLSKEREAISGQMETAMNSELKPEGISIISVSLRDIDPPDSVVKAIEQKNVALQNKAKTQTEAESALIEAKGKTAVINELDRALTASPRYLQYLMIDRLGDQVKVIVTSDGSVPLLDVNDANAK